MRFFIVFISFVFLISNSFGQLTISETPRGLRTVLKTAYSDTIYFDNGQAKKVVFFDSTSQKLGEAHYEYYANDTLKTIRFKSKETTFTREYDHLGNSIKFIALHGKSKETFRNVYEYDEQNRIIRYRRYYMNHGLVLSWGLHYTDNLLTRKDFYTDYHYTNSDELLKWINYEHNSDGEIVAWEEFSFDTTLTGARKTMRLLPDGPVKDYSLDYRFDDGLLYSIRASPYGIPYKDFYTTRKTIEFQVDNQGKLVSYTFYNHRGDDIGTMQDKDEGQVFKVDSTSQNHPAVIHFHEVNAKNSKLRTQKESDYFFNLPTGIH